MEPGSLTSRCQKGWFLMRTHTLLGLQTGALLLHTEWSFLCACRMRETRREEGDRREEEREASMSSISSSS
jgi:hypothetical protein